MVFGLRTREPHGDELELARERGCATRPRTECVVGWSRETVRNRPERTAHAQRHDARGRQGALTTHVFDVSPRQLGIACSRCRTLMPRCLRPRPAGAVSLCSPAAPAERSACLKRRDRRRTDGGSEICGVRTDDANTLPVAQTRVPRLRSFSVRVRLAVLFFERNFAFRTAHGAHAW